MININYKINTVTVCSFSYTFFSGYNYYICPSPYPPPPPTRVSTSLTTTVTTLNGADNDQTNTLRLTVDQLIVTSTTLTINTNIDNFVSNMLNVFNFILTDPSFMGQSLFVQSMKSFAYSLVEGETCPTSNTEVLKSYSRPAFVLEALKIRPSLLTSRQFMSSDSSDYIQFPSQGLTTSQTVS